MYHSMYIHKQHRHISVVTLSTQARANNIHCLPPFQQFLDTYIGREMDVQLTLVNYLDFTCLE